MPSEPAGFVPLSNLTQLTCCSENDENQKQSFEISFELLMLESELRQSAEYATEMLRK